jgi:Ran GTPase-activating protein (RanGAP) involved in mRNA processing and transport
MSSIKNILNEHKLVHLNLASNKITSEGLKVIFESLTGNPVLRELNLGVHPRSLHRNILGVAGAKYLALVVMKSPVLEALLLEENELGKDGAVILAQALAESHSLKRLSLRNNGIGLAGTTSLFQYGLHLTHLDISHNQLTPEIYQPACQYLVTNNGLTDLTL